MTVYDDFGVQVEGALSVSNDSETRYIKELPVASNAKIRIIFSDFDKSVSAFYVSQDNDITSIGAQNLPKHLREISELEVFDVFFNQAYATATLFDNGEVGCKIYHQLLGGMPPKLTGSVETNVVGKSTVTNTTVGVNTQSETGHVQVGVVVAHQTVTNQGQTNVSKPTIGAKIKFNF